MGLSVYAYEHAHRTPEHELTDDCYDNHIQAGTPFKRSLRGLIEDRCYLTSGRTLNFDRSYGGYNEWRSALCLLALECEPEEVWKEADEWVDQPFFELIHFSDAEGTIGPEACTDLAADFISHRSTIQPQLVAGMNRWNRWDELYDNFTEAFVLAAGSGLVRFA